MRGGLYAGKRIGRSGCYEVFYRVPLVYLVFFGHSLDFFLCRNVSLSFLLSDLFSFFLLIIKHILSGESGAYRVRVRVKEGVQETKAGATNEYIKSSSA